MPEYSVQFALHPEYIGPVDKGDLPDLGGLLRHIHMPVQMPQPFLVSVEHPNVVINAIKYLVLNSWPDGTLNVLYRRSGLDS